MLKNILLLIFSLFAIPNLAQQTFEWEETAIKRYKTNKKGMLVLGTWATLNIIGGTIVSFQTTGTEHYFYQMNAGWNAINLAIALPTFLKSYKTPKSFSDNLREQQLIEKILLLNVGLDVAYMVGGLYLNQLSLSEPNGEMLKGYGNSILLQGGFLFVFDIGLYIFTNKNSAQIYKFTDKLSLSDSGVGIKLKF